MARFAGLLIAMLWGCPQWMLVVHGTSRQHATLLSRRRADSDGPAAVGLAVQKPTYPPPWWRQPSPTYAPCKFSVCVPGITHPFPEGTQLPPPPPPLSSPGVTADDFRHTDLKPIGPMPTEAPPPCPRDPAAPRPSYCPEPPQPLAGAPAPALP
mmetsp:Transcript_3580/g.5785  ORF Transcript_3580/g.5785 Transcript_3580/m.5785 type:complete len:154 (+) Transcript_3580:84-545(+)